MGEARILLSLALSLLVLALGYLIINPIETGRVTESMTTIGETTTSIEQETTFSTTSVTTTTEVEKTTTTTTQTTTRSTSTTIKVQTTTTMSEKDLCEDLGCPLGTRFVGSKNSNKYHYCDCKWAERIKKENLVCFKSVEEAEERGYEPCGTCKPPGSTSTTSTVHGTTTIETIDSCVSLGCPSGTQFVGSKNSNKYHYCRCYYAKKIKPENLICFQSVEEAKSKGYEPCGKCKPPE
jgi:hypothetical protein